MDFNVWTPCLHCKGCEELAQIKASWLFFLYLMVKVSLSEAMCLVTYRVVKTQPGTLATPCLLSICTHSLFTGRKKAQCSLSRHSLTQSLCADFKVRQHIVLVGALLWRFYKGLSVPSSLLEVGTYFLSLVEEAWISIKSLIHRLFFFLLLNWIWFSVYSHGIVQY